MKHCISQAAIEKYPVLKSFSGIIIDSEKLSGCDSELNEQQIIHIATKFKQEYEAMEEYIGEDGVAFEMLEEYIGVGQARMIAELCYPIGLTEPIENSPNKDILIEP